MSAVVKTRTPFILKKCLLDALDKLDVVYQTNGENIITERTDYYGKQIFVWNETRYVFQHDSSAERNFYPWRRENTKEWQTVTEFLSEVEKSYNFAYNNYMRELEQERLLKEKRRIEEARKKHIQSQKEAIIAKAKEQGYRVKEKKVGKNIQLVLVRQT